MLDFKVNFFLYKAKKRKDNLAPIYLRIMKLSTGEKISFTTRLYCSSKEWNSKTKCLRGCSSRSSLVNQNLKRLRNQVEEFILKESLYESDIPISDFEVFQHSRKEKQDTTLLGVIDEYLTYVKSLVGIDYTQSTYEKYSYASSLYDQYLTYSKKGKAFNIKKVSEAFLDDLTHFFKTVKGYTPNTTVRALKRFNTILKYAQRKDYLLKNPFDTYKMPQVKKEIKFLTKQELELLEQTKLDRPGLDRVRRMFLFSCYTGLAYQEAKNLKHGDIYSDNSGQEWIKIRRQKTQLDYVVPLLPKAKEILSWFNKQAEETKQRDYALPMVSNQKFNAHLKEIAPVAGIDREISHHMARKTFATTVLLNNGVPMDAVSKMLGHSSISITESSYAKYEVNRLQQIVSKIT